MTKILFDPQQNYDCVQCGRGCRAGWDIPVEPEVVTRLQGHPLTLRVIEERGSAFRQVEEKVFIQNSKDCPNCGFLDSDQLCSIHRELGFEAKPATCKLFPFVMTQTPEGVYAGTTYYCSAVRQNHGRPSSAHQEDLLDQLAHSAPINRVADDGLVIHNRYYISYADYLGVEEELRRRAAQVGYLNALSHATLGLACVMAELPELEEEIVPIGHRLAEMWKHPAMPGGSATSQLRSLGNLQLCDYFKVYSLERSMWGQLDDGMFDGTPISLPAYQWRGTLDELHKLVDSRFDRQIERYLEHLVFRKALVVHPPLLASLMQLQVLPTFLKVYAGLFAHRGGHSLCEQDYYDALEHAEMYLVTHGRDRRFVHEMAVEEMLKILRS